MVEGQYFSDLRRNSCRCAWNCCIHAAHVDAVLQRLLMRSGRRIRRLVNVSASGAIAPMVNEFNVTVFVITVSVQLHHYPD